MLNTPLYIVSRNVNGCANDRDCQQALPFARCNVITHLCSATNGTNFIDLQNSTTNATSTTVSIATSTTAVESTTGGSSTVASEMRTTTPTILSTTTTTTSMPTTTITTTSMPTTTTTTTSMPITTTTPSSYDIITEGIRLKILSMHNYRRSRLAQGLVPNGKTGGNLPAGSDIFRMTYSVELERAAQAYANTCPSEGSTSLTTIGENFASIPSNTMEVYDCVTSAIKSFWSQIKTESINSKVMFTEKLMTRPKGPLKFTQMAWATTREVGCGAQRCGANTVVVCRYSPRGNIVNENIYRQGQMCSSCPYGGCITAHGQQGLCPAFRFN
ncbi:hypothetical protein GCK32_010888 [Trichostrongylus colubriformis]|uniref:SCP domain-containing protein n=1 Tax=Trichostrongylus colubriformis TaxID=6319 RepID=A0AAN8EVB4_TRICO